MGEGIEDARHEFGEREERAMNSRTRPGRVPAHVEAMGDDGSVLADVIAGRPIYPDPEEEETRTRVIPSKRLFDRVGDLEVREELRERHLGILGDMVNQLIEEVNELRDQLGLGPWQPMYRRNAGEDRP